MNSSKTLSENFSSWQRWGLGWIPFWAASYIVIKGAILRPEEIPEALTQINDKLLHFLQYFFLFFFAVNAFTRAKTFWIRLYPRLYGVIDGLILGVLTECLQFRVPGRSPEVMDWVADAGGTLLALAVYSTAYRVLQTVKK